MQTRRLSILLVNLFSQNYPAIGESHGLSVVAGALHARLADYQFDCHVVDMVTYGDESLDLVAEIVRTRDVNVLAIGLPYGTYTAIRREFGKLHTALGGRDSLVIFGGALATYLGSRILTEISPEAFVIEGEAEEAVAGLVRSWASGSAPSGVPGVLYRDPQTGQETRNPRRLVSLDEYGTPYRRHIPQIQAIGGQIFVESSRGCSWSACTFCLRGLTDVHGRSREYRRRSAALIAGDIATLNAIGIKEFTFADEDFLGPSVDDAEAFVGQLEKHRGWTGLFDASLTVHSVFSRKDDESLRRRREALLLRLRALGLRRVFLGVESCSQTQLKRYAKGHSPLEAVEAVNLLRRLDFRVEVGVILFDPLCTLEEVEESLVMMKGSQMARVASGLSSELRLQQSSHYLRMLRLHESAHDVRLVCGDLDPDTLSYPYKYVDSRVARLASYIADWASRVHPVYYPAKSLTRFGETGALGAAADSLKKLVEDFREQYATATLAAIQIARDGESSFAAIDPLFDGSKRQLARHLRQALLSASETLRAHPMIKRALAATELTHCDTSA